MIPRSSDFNVQGVAPRLEDRTFRMNLEKPSIETAFVDGLEALRQRIFCILSTERGEHVILRNYGVAKNDAIGADKDYAFAVLCKRIEEALLEDDCITEVTDFEMVPELSQGDNLFIRLRVESVFGDVEVGGDFNV